MESDKLAQGHREDVAELEFKPSQRSTFYPGRKWLAKLSPLREQQKGGVFRQPWALATSFLSPRIQGGAALAQELLPVLS